ncbi:type I-G CRISPR-associated protein Cas8g1/Csx17 [Paludibaculum fermentans]|uniref:type I-G CRISPR-associated protein Cas8g1/Csx17 n=1 Tax=Paludibaculum fermentans TaxID=1473598 RepID=UPI003EBF79BD
MSLYIHVLSGCSPIPLASYLKSLGILRLLVRQGFDPNARGWWQDRQFNLLTKLDRDQLEDCFLTQYEPTPLLSPWNKGCGFYKPGDPGLTPLEHSTADRFAVFRRGIAQARTILDATSNADAVIRSLKARTKTNRAFQSDQQREVLKGSEIYSSTVQFLREQLSTAQAAGSPQREATESDLSVVEQLVAHTSKPPSKAEADRIKASSGYKRLLSTAERRYKSLKATLIADCYRTWRGPHSDWLSAAVVLDDEGGQVWPSLLGTGGNDGNLDFTNNFMQRLGELFEILSPTGRPRPNSRELLSNALWSDPTRELGNSAIGQFHPGAAGGANATTGAIGESLVNPWDFVLMMEGTILLSPRITRRLDQISFSHAAAPFVVRSHSVGNLSPGDENAQRGEQWMPLWSRPAALDDIVALFGDGRVQLNRQTAAYPIDAARAVGRLGVARGISAFTRFGYLERNGQSTLAVPLGFVEVRPSTRGHLVDDLSPWLDRLRRLTRSKTAPASLIHRERQLANAVMAALTHDDSTQRWQAVLLAAVNIERLQSTGTAIEVGPIPPLAPHWISACGGDATIRLALALGSAAGSYSRLGRPHDPVRHHWLALETGARRFRLSGGKLANDARVVAPGFDPLVDCSSLVKRRIIEAATQGSRHLAIVSPVGYAARLPDLALLLRGEVDLNVVVSLARAFMALSWDRIGEISTPPNISSADRPLESWLALRLSCLPWPLYSVVDIPTEPGLLYRLLAGDGTGAVRIALDRLRAARIRVPLQAAVMSPQTSRLWAAALAFPIDRHTARQASTELDPALKGSPNV